MKLLILLFAMFFGFGLLIQNTFSVKQPKHQIRYENPQSTASPAAVTKLAPQVG